VIFITAQNLVGIDAVVLKICMSFVSPVRLENGYSRPQNWDFGGAFPQMVSLIVLTPKRTVRRKNHVIRAIKREYRPRGSSLALERENRTVGYMTGQDRKKSQNGYVLPTWGVAPIEAIYF